jgi:hypothetical protein
MPERKLNELTVAELVDDITKVLKDAVYASIGLGVLASEKLTEQRKAFQGSVSERIGAGRTELDTFSKRFDDGVKSVEARLTALEQRLEKLVDKVQERLPEQVADLMAQARKASGQARAQWREVFGRPTEGAEAA